eukprot:3869396-Ditylum_brightwellii.AAC.1
MKWLRKALRLLDNCEVTTGLKLFGTPLGSAHFASEIFTKITTKIQDDTNTIFSALEDTQMATQLYSTCVLQRLPFHTASDVLHNVDISRPLNPFYGCKAANNG